MSRSRSRSRSRSGSGSGSRALPKFVIGEDAIEPKSFQLVKSIPEHVVPWDMVQHNTDVMYLLALFLCSHHGQAPIKRKTLVDVTHLYIQQWQPHRFSSREAKTPIRSLSASLTKALRDDGKHSTGRLIGMLQVIEPVKKHRGLRLLPYFRPGEWSCPETQLMFWQVIQQRLKREQLKTMPNIAELVSLTDQHTVHGFGLIARTTLKAHTSLYLYYLGNVRLMHEIPDLKPDQISYRFTPIGFDYIVIDPADKSGNFTHADRVKFPAASINEARHGKRANCAFSCDSHFRWLINVVVLDKDIAAGQELLVDRYNHRQNIDPVVVSKHDPVVAGVLPAHSLNGSQPALSL